MFLLLIEEVVVIVLLKNFKYVFFFFQDLVVDAKDRISLKEINEALHRMVFNSSDSKTVNLIFLGVLIIVWNFQCKNL